jgi:hypothetical protein
MVICSVVFIIMLKVNIAEHFPTIRERDPAALEAAATTEYRNDKYFNEQRNTSRTTECSDNCGSHQTPQLPTPEVTITFYIFPKLRLEPINFA